MKKIVLATALLARGSASSMAADLPERGMVAKAPMMAPVNNWSGLYLGGNVGYGWGNGTIDLTPHLVDVDPAGLDTKSNGVIGGAQIGYNWQIGAVVTGLEADIQGSSIKGSAHTTLKNTDGTTPVDFSASSKLSWFGTVRGRLGATVTPDLLIYGTGGLAYGHVSASADTFFDVFNDFPGSVSKTNVGWTAGAGAEWMFARNWSAKLEYLYLDLGNVSTVARNHLFPDSSSAAVYTLKSRENIVRAGVNYHF
jgi:outer membrane immunogenic protein